MTFKLGATLYSFNSELYSYKYSMEDCMELLSTLGEGQGVELVGPMQIREYPDVSPEFVARFKRALDKYGLTPTAYGAYTDATRITGHKATVDEKVEYMKRQLRAAKELGFPVARVGPFEETFALLPYAERLGIKLGMEVHAPLSIEGLQDIVARVEKTSSAYLGWIPDCGAFCERPSHVFVERFTSQGVDPEIVNHIVQRWAERPPVEELCAEVREMGGDEHAEMMAFESNIYFGHSQPEVLKQVMPYIVHLHGKFFGIDDSGNESAVRLPEVITVLRDGGYSEYISCEYEGHHWFPERDSFDQIKRLQSLIQGLAQS